MRSCLPLLALLILPLQATRVPSPPNDSAVGQALNLDVLRENDFEITRLDGQHVKLNSLLGTNRPVVIDFWATWCAPCRKEAPHLVELARRYQDWGLVVIGLTVEDPSKDTEKVKQFVDKFGTGYPVGFANHTVYRFLDGGGNIAVPRVFVFAADGRLIGRFGKYYPWRTNHEIAQAVERAVAGK